MTVLVRTGVEVPLTIPGVPETQVVVPETIAVPFTMAVALTMCVVPETRSDFPPM